MMKKLFIFLLLAIGLLTTVGITRAEMGNCNMAQQTVVFLRTYIAEDYYCDLYKVVGNMFGPACICEVCEAYPSFEHLGTKCFEIKSEVFLPIAP